MLKKITLTKFKKHESLSIDFTGGLVVLRGANEAGKSTVYHAVAYALYGSRGLPDTVEETVTYGFPASQLKVELEFSHCGVDYNISRSKSGATIAGGGNTSSGQAEVTSFITKLFGVRQEVATKITIANQGSLKAAVEGGVQAVQLIESLSGMDLIDELIGKVQAQLPCGNAAGISAQVAKLEAAQKPTADFSAQEDAVNTARLALGAEQSKLGMLQDQLDAIEVAKVRAALKAAEENNWAYKSAISKVHSLGAILEKPMEPRPVDRREAIQAEIDAGREAAEARKAYVVFLSIQQPDVVFVDADEFSSELQAVKEVVRFLATDISRLNQDIAIQESGLITEDSCSLCGKMLQDVPEVVELNTKQKAKVEVLQWELAHTQEQLEKYESRLEHLTALGLVHQKVKLELAPISKFLRYLPGFPVRAAWASAVPEPVVETPDYKAMLQANSLELSRWDAANATRTAYAEDYEKAKALAESLSLIDVSTFEASIASWESTNVQVKAKQADVLRKTSELAAAESSLNLVKSRFNSELAAYRLSQTQLAEARTLLSEYTDNNELIAKLRNARPVVAKQLWNTVLHTVSHYFSMIRGTPSVVTKSDKGFLVDGKPYTNLSGSTIDSLGLAVRMALQKTFLPALDFMLLDEPASGMDDSRESAMLGTLASCGYSQVVLVTHSELADTFAAQVVRI